MIEEARQELAIKYVLDELDDVQAAVFRRELGADDDVRSFVAEMTDTVAEMALSVPPKDPPADLFARVLRQVHGEHGSPKVIRFPWLPWALAASLALACALSFSDRHRLERQVAALQDRDALSRMKIATLASQADAYAKALAVVVWDEEKQRGVVNVEHLSKLSGDRDYQLWVIDPNRTAPVSAGVLNVAEDEMTQASFHPEQAVGVAGKFAISVERKGGSVSPEGEIIFVSR